MNKFQEIVYKILDELGYEEVQSTVDEDMQSTVDEDMQSTVDEDMQSTVNEDMQSTVDEDMQSTVDEDMQSTVDEDMQSTVDEDMQSTVDEDMQSTVNEDMQSIAIEDGINSILFKNSQKEESQYYVVSSCNEEYFQNLNLDELQIIVYDKIKKLFDKEPAVDKNTSWIIGVECNNNYEDIMSKVLQIEENPYYFKKMVCPYLQEEVDKFSGEIGDYSKYIEYIQKVVLEVDRFVDFYDGKDMVYDFISRLFIKLPSIELPVIKDKGLNNLSDEIEKKVKENELQNMHIFLLDNINAETNLTDEGITTLYELYFGKDSEDEKI